MKPKEIVIIGAGPYGLSAAAHLQDAGVDPYVIGKPMSFWKEQMPAKMLLRSRIEASNLAAPGERLSLVAFQKASKRKLPEPLPIEDFIEYGEWFQKQVAPDPDIRDVKEISRNGGPFEITFEDGEKIHAKSVVLALGIGKFSRRPEQFAGLPRELAPHTSDLNDLERFRGKKVVVIGKGQSALEYAALLHETGADVEIFTRGAGIAFRPFAWRKHLFRQLTAGPLRGISHKILPPTDLGDIHTARKMAHPSLFRRQSAAVQESLLKDCQRPVGAYWLAARLQGIPIVTGVTVVSAEMRANGIKLHLNDGCKREVDFVVLGTGYRIDISKYGILDKPLEAQVAKMPDGYPRLGTNLETSVKGLYMAGVVAEKTLGPTLRFVTGTSNAGPRLAESIAGMNSNQHRQNGQAQERALE